MSESTLLFRPQPKQVEFLSTSADIAIYGGAAGGGKSWALCYDPLRHIGVPGFSGVIFRRTYPEIMSPGGLWDQAGEMYPVSGGKGIRGETEYRWDNGTRISFRHLEHTDSVTAWQGSQICYLAFDELSHFTEHQFFYLLSRNRSMCGIRPYVRATCNPDPGWLKRFLAPWVDEEYKGIRAAPGEVRHFLRVDGKIRWVPRTTKDAKSVAFIPASVYDNKALLDANPEYIGNLKALPEIERRRLLDGDWRVRREGLVYRNFERCVIDSPLHLEVPPTDGGIDWGWSNPFAAVWGHFSGDDVLYITGGRYRRETGVAEHSAALPKNIAWMCDPADPESRLELLNAGHSVRPCIHHPTRGAGGERRNPKMSGIAMVSTRMDTGRLKIVRCDGTAALIRELGLYHYDPEKGSEEPVDEDNHTADALRYLVVGHDRGRLAGPIESDAEIAASVQAAASREAAAKEEEERLRWETCERRRLQHPLDYIDDDDRWFKIEGMSW